MICGQERVRRYKWQALSARLSALSWLLIAGGLSATVAQVGSATMPIEVSSKEADDNLQVKTLQPDYPPEAEAKGIEGTVRLKIAINERGNVTDVKTLSGDPLLVPPAIALVKRFPYRPFIRKGKRVAVTTEVAVPFVLHPTTRKEIYDSWMSHREAARILRKNGKMDAGVGELQSALVDAKQLGDIEVADTYGDIAYLYSREGRYSDAEPALTERLGILRHSRIQDELEIANTQADLATAYLLMRKDLAEAQRLLQRALPVQEKYFKHATLQFSKDTYAHRLALSLGSLALLHDLQGEFSAAEPLYKRSISLGEQRLSADDEAIIMQRYAEMLVKMGRSAEAAKLREGATALQLGIRK